MFTGIITDLGEVVQTDHDAGLRARLKTAWAPHSLDIGASVACSGVCLTVIARGAAGNGAWFEVDISEETLARSTLGAWAPGTAVNLERSLKMGDEMGGHIVAGHVDGLATIVSAEPEADSIRFTLDAPEDLARFIAPKGSIALDGTSLTVNGVEGARFDVNLIPHTRAVTTWGRSKPGDRVNLEVDTVARYVARLMEAR